MNNLKMEDVIKDKFSIIEKIIENFENHINKYPNTRKILLFDSNDDWPVSEKQYITYCYNDKYFNSKIEYSSCDISAINVSTINIYLANNEDIIVENYIDIKLDDILTLNCELIFPKVCMFCLNILKNPGLESFAFDLKMNFLCYVKYYLQITNSSLKPIKSIVEFKMYNENHTKCVNIIFKPESEFYRNQGTKF